ncbi:3-hydroxyisobutyrate dehydrogenase [Mycena galericulata]|nr:3-hydroxyisobutyrate dehydrogenase [Mycena galericulata]
MLRPTRVLCQFKRESTVGFLGLGQMGYNMANNLLCRLPTPSNSGSSTGSNNSKAGFVIYDNHQPAVDSFLNQHASASSNRDVIPSSSPAGVVQLASTIFTVLPSSPHVEEVYLGENGLLESLESLSEEKKKETLFVDCTTLDQGVAKERGMIDAPVSGGVVGAQGGTLSFMVGGDDSDFQRARKFLDLMGRRAIHCGDSGNGLAAKICNNLLLGITMAGTAEAMLLGQSLGLHPELLASIINTSTGKCWSSESNNPAPGRLILVDLNLAISASKDSSTPLPLGNLTTTLYNTLTSHEEFADKDFSVIYEYLSEATGKK